MTDLKFDVTIDGQTYTDEQLARYQYERTLHGLHEMKRLGADVRDGDRELSHIDINWLDPDRAARISLDLRDSLGEEGILDLFKDVLEDTDRRWREYTEGYVEGDLHTSLTEIEVTGVSVPETAAVLGGAANARDALKVMPEHYIVTGDLQTGQRGMETFGMFGEPSFAHGSASDTVPPALEFARDTSYPLVICGEMRLKSDDTPIHVGALHQFRPTADGFVMKSHFFCPSKAPRAIADGHTLHFAIELTNCMKVAHAHKQVASA